MIAKTPKLREKYTSKLLYPYLFLPLFLTLFTIFSLYLVQVERMSVQRLAPMSMNYSDFPGYVSNNDRTISFSNAASPSSRNFPLTPTSHNLQNDLPMDSMNITIRISLLWMATNTSIIEEQMQVERFKYFLFFLVHIDFKFELINFVLFLLSLVLEACATLHVHWRARPRQRWRIESSSRYYGSRLIGLRLTAFCRGLRLLVWSLAIRSFRAEEVLGRI